MQLKILGAICVIASCGGWGILSAVKYRLKIREIQELVDTLQYMVSELQYRGTPLPQLCYMAAEQSHGKTREVFLELSNELNSQISPNAQKCMTVVLYKHNDMSHEYRHLLNELGNGLGKFDLLGQVRALEHIKACGSEILRELSKNKDTRLRSYQTLGLCAGAAIAILLV